MDSVSLMSPNSGGEITGLFVGDLSIRCRDEDLKQTFQHYGPLLKFGVRVDTKDFKITGYGFVTFVNPSDAATALKTLNKQMLFGRKLRLRPARREVQDGSVAQYAECHFSFVSKNTTAFLYEETIRELLLELEIFEPVLDVCIKTYKINKASYSGVGFVRFAFSHEGALAMKTMVYRLRNKVVDGITFDSNVANTWNLNHKRSISATQNRENNNINSSANSPISSSNNSSIYEIIYTPTAAERVLEDARKPDKERAIQPKQQQLLSRSESSESSDCTDMQSPYVSANSDFAPSPAVSSVSDISPRTEYSMSATVTPGTPYHKSIMMSPGGIPMQQQQQQQVYCGTYEKDSSTSVPVLAVLYPTRKLPYATWEEMSHMRFLSDAQDTLPSKYEMRTEARDRERMLQVQQGYGQLGYMQSVGPPGPHEKAEQPSLGRQLHSPQQLPQQPSVSAPRSFPMAQNRQSSTLTMQTLRSGTPTDIRQSNQQTSPQIGNSSAGSPASHEKVYAAHQQQDKGQPQQPSLENRKSPRAADRGLPVQYQVQHRSPRAVDRSLPSSPGKQPQQQYGGDRRQRGNSSISIETSPAELSPQTPPQHMHPVFPGMRSPMQMQQPGFLPEMTMYPHYVVGADGQLYAAMVPQMTSQQMSPQMSPMSPQQLAQQYAYAAASPQQQHSPLSLLSPQQQLLGEQMYSPAQQTGSFSPAYSDPQQLQVFENQVGQQTSPQALFTVVHGDPQQLLMQQQQQYALYQQQIMMQQYQQQLQYQQQMMFGQPGGPQFIASPPLQEQHYMMSPQQQQRFLSSPGPQSHLSPNEKPQVLLHNGNAPQSSYASSYVQRAQAQEQLQTQQAKYQQQLALSQQQQQKQFLLQKQQQQLQKLQQSGALPKPPQKQHPVVQKLQQMYSSPLQSPLQQGAKSPGPPQTSASPVQHQRTPDQAPTLVVRGGTFPAAKITGIDGVGSVATFQHEGPIRSRSVLSTIEDLTSGVSGFGVHEKPAPLGIADTEQSDK